MQNRDEWCLRLEFFYCEDHVGRNLALALAPEEPNVYRHRLRRPTALQLSAMFRGKGTPGGLRFRSSGAREMLDVESP
jgi:hypothetical protein